jgi:serine protease Do
MDENTNNFNPNTEPTEPTVNPFSETETNSENSQPATENTSYSSYQQTAPQGQDFSMYNDPVDGTNPNNNAQPNDSAYSPYSQQGYSQQSYSQQGSYYSSPYYTPPTYPADETPAPKNKNKGFKAFVIASVAIVVCVALLIAAYPVFSGKKAPENNTPSGGDSGIVLNESPDVSAYKESLSTIEIADKVEKINVGILIYGKGQSFMSGSPNSLQGEGSGIVMKVDKSTGYTYILTCAHVISNAQKTGYTITVQDSDGNTYDASLVGLDAKTDIGVIKVQDTSFTVADFGDSSSLRKGQKVFAIGNPGGTVFFGSFTDGMISSIDRPISSESGYEMKCIQHTTPINSGNSGGALLNEFGQVIGINSAKIVSTGYEGMAFAIPISDAKPIIDDIIANGHVTNRPKLGITYAPAMEYQQYAMIVQLKDLPTGSLIIASIAEDSSLAKTEAKPYDLITKVDGQPLDSADVLLDKIENGKVGTKLKLTLCRINDDYSIEEFEVTATLVEDKGTTVTEEPSTQSFWEQYFNEGF